jgi:hypothetical protein
MSTPTTTTTTTTTTQPRGPRPERTYLVGTGDTGKPLHIEIEIRAHEGKPDELSICGTYDGASGQILESLGELSPDRLAPGWTPARVDELRSIWEHWHLNGMHAGCSHQRALGWGHGKTIALSPDDLTEAQREAIAGKAQATAGRARDKWKAREFAHLGSGRARVAWFSRHSSKSRLTIDTDNAIERWILRKGAPTPAVGYQALECTLTAWLTEDAIAAVPAEIFKGAIYEDSLGAPCPECGYCYGSAWLSEPLPDAVYAFVDSLPTGDTRSPYEIQAAAFLARWGIHIHADHACAKGNDWARAHQHWRIRLTRGRRSFSFDFWDSEANTAKGKRVAAYSVLSCLASESCYDDIDEAARELELPPRKARALVAFSRRIGRFFDEPGMLEALREIQ